MSKKRLSAIVVGLGVLSMSFMLHLAFSNSEDLGSFLPANAFNAKLSQLSEKTFKRGAVTVKNRTTTPSYLTSRVTTQKNYQGSRSRGGMQ